MGYGVIGNTSDSGSFVLGSSPGIPALNSQIFSGCFCFNLIMDKLERNEADLYFKRLAPTQAQILLDLKDRLVHLAKAEPELIISYQLPTIRVTGQNFLAFAAWKDFYSIYLLSGRLGKVIEADLAQGELDKSTLRFSWDEKVTNKTLKLIIEAKKVELEQNKK